MNQYDDYRPDVAALLRDQDRSLGARDPSARSADGLTLGERARQFLELYLTGALLRARIHQRLVHSSLELGWFWEFRDYWCGELGNRPIAPPDFHYLHGTYRSRFQSLGLPEQGGDAAHLEAWRDPALVYHLFAYQYQYALLPLSAYPFRRYIRAGSDVCEYGCGIAPIATSLVRYHRALDLRITIADIPHIVFHFARWKFRNVRYVHPVTLPVESDTPLAEDHDVIFCLTVLEHVPRPLALARHLHERIRPGGYLMFDFIASHGHGLDSPGAVDERLETLRFICDSFEIVEGGVPLDGTGVATVVARKPR